MLQRMNLYQMGSISVVILTNFDGSIGEHHLKLTDTIRNKEVSHDLQKQVPVSCLFVSLLSRNFIGPLPNDIKAKNRNYAVIKAWLFKRGNRVILFYLDYHYRFSILISDWYKT